MSASAVITGSGLYTPKEAISNEELVTSFNAWVDLFNTEHSEDIAKGEIEAKTHSSAEFIEKASGIKSRYVINKAGILDPHRMVPEIPERSNEEPSVMCEIACQAAEQALAESGIGADQLDAVILAASNMQRAYPAMAVEVQAALGAGGFAFDMNVACSSATFGIQQASDAVKSGSARRVLVVNPEICTGHLNFRDRDSHFIFGDVATAVVIESSETAQSDTGWDILDTRLQTLFSNNIRNNFGFLNRADERGIGQTDKLFIQEGRKVFKEVCPAVAEQITAQLAAMDLSPDDLRRIWLHQANQNMNDLIARKVFGRDPSALESPTILDEYANTSSAGSIIAFHKHSADLVSGDLAVLCSFGAGYSIGSIVLRRR
ncbi:MAG: beta-ketoacyl-ACP synthase III [Luminiphilus sp.]|jgi:beta-ketodecanoyl-[acyl-carrier-protein] synthase|nr:beta-ketoacyl-ACP synthase III [Luminiphilus sp.]MDG2037925.1 beta-ketoacyl-ACP synthase III [Luminiphilus sp.]RZO80303.1 MAG: beta-ketoacyl-ACP synthase III [Halieaceae bacterium]